MPSTAFWKPINTHRGSSSTLRSASGRACAKEHPEYPIAEPTLRRYVRQRKQELGLGGRVVCVPQSYEYGQEAQVDWYEAVAILGGDPTKRNHRSSQS